MDSVFVMVKDSLIFHFSFLCTTSGYSKTAIEKLTRIQSNSCSGRELKAFAVASLAEEKTERLVVSKGTMLLKKMLVPCDVS